MVLRLMGDWRTVYDSEAIVKRFDERQKIVGIAADERDEAVLTMIPFKAEDTFRLLDLGAGMGRFSHKIAGQFPRAQITCVDGSEKMLQAAKDRITENVDQFSFVCADFGNASWIESVSGAFDVIVSTGAIHHINDARKWMLFAEIHGLLKDGGFFINGELVRSKYDVLNAKYYDDIWASYIQEKTKEVLGVQRLIKDVRERMYEAMKREGDTPATVEDQLEWLREAGFKVAECVWRHYLIAVVVGIR